MVVCVSLAFMWHIQALGTGIEAVTTSTMASQMLAAFPHNFKQRFRTTSAAFSQNSKWIGVLSGFTSRPGEVRYSEAVQEGGHNHKSQVPEMRRSRKLTRLRAFQAAFPQLQGVTPQLQRPLRNYHSHGHSKRRVAHQRCPQASSRFLGLVVCVCE